MVLLGSWTPHSSEYTLPPPNSTTSTATLQLAASLLRHRRPSYYPLIRGVFGYFVLCVPSSAPCVFPPTRVAFRPLLVSSRGHSHQFVPSQSAWGHRCLLGRRRWIPSPSEMTGVDPGMPSVLALSSLHRPYE